MTMLWGLALIACGDDATTTGTGTADSGTAATSEFGSLGEFVEGDPGLESMQGIAFASDGTLAIGDGRGSQLVAIAPLGGGTTDHEPDIDNVYQLIAEAMGESSATSVSVWDLAVDPTTQRIYLAAERISTGEAALFRVEDDDTVSAVDLSDVAYSAASFSPTSGSGSLVMGISWGADYLTAGVTEATWTTNQVVSAAMPLDHGDDSTVTTTNTYHRTHTRWETWAPIVTLAPFTHDGVDYVAGTYTCTPTVRFTQTSLAAGESETVGETPFDYGGGKQVHDMVINSEGVYATIEGLFGNEFQGWDMFGVVRVNLERMTQSEAIDENAMQVVGVKDAINHPDAERFEALDGSFRLALLDDDTMVALQQAGLFTHELSSR